MIFYLISKLLPLIFLPLGLGIIIYFLGIITKRRIYFIISFIPVLLFSLGSVSEVLWALLESPWQRLTPNEITRSDAIVVLSGARHPSPGKNQVLEWLDPDRFLAGIELFKDGKAPIIVFTNGKSPYQSNIKGEGYFYKKEAIKLGIPKEAIKNTTEVHNTIEESIAVKNILSNKYTKDKNNIILVTSAFHMIRAKRLFEKKGIKVQAYPVDFQSQGSWAGSRWNDPLMWVPNANNLSESSAAIREFFGRTFYKLTQL